MAESSIFDIIHYGNGNYKNIKSRCGMKIDYKSSVTLEKVTCRICIQIVIAEKDKLIVVSRRHKGEWQVRLRELNG